MYVNCYKSRENFLAKYNDIQIEREGKKKAKNPKEPQTKSVVHHPHEDVER